LWARSIGKKLNPKHPAFRFSHMADIEIYKRLAPPPILSRRDPAYEMSNTQKLAAQHEILLGNFSPREMNRFGDRSALAQKSECALLVSVWRICLRFAAATQSHLGHCAPQPASPQHSTRCALSSCMCVDYFRVWLVHVRAYLLVIICWKKEQQLYVFRERAACF
jgi:hypothetical protein